MAFGESGNNGWYMPVQPATNGGYGNAGFGFGNGFGGDLFYLLILFLFMFNGNWGNGFGFGGGGGMMPFMMNNTTNNDVQRGFDHQAIMNGLNGLTATLASISQALCSGFNSVNQAIAGAAAQAEISANNRQMANMNQMFGVQTAMGQGFNGVSMQLNGLGADIAREACSDRQATNDAMMAISNKIDALGNQMTVMNYQNQLGQKDAIIGQKDDIIAQLRSEALYSRGQISQDNQTARIELGQRNLANEVEQYVAPRAIPAYIVQNPSCCNQGYGWNGCACGA